MLSDPMPPALDLDKLPFLQEVNAWLVPLWLFATALLLVLLGYVVVAGIRELRARRRDVAGPQYRRAAL